MHKEFIQKGENVFAIQRKNTEVKSYIKNNSEQKQKFYGNVQSEFDSYNLISPHLKTPKYKMASLPSAGEILLIRGVNGESLENKLKNNSDVVPTLNLLYSDIFKMWNKTKVAKNEEEMARNSRLESIQTLGKLNTFFGENSNLRKNTIINGQNYASIYQSFKQVYENLMKGQSENIMVLAHGDEHFGNIFQVENDYQVIDPRCSGFYYPSQTLNTTIGSSLAFSYSFQDQKITENQNNLFLNFTIDSKLDKLLINFLNLFQKSLDYTQSSILPELLFVNLLRASMGFVNAKNSQKVAQNKIALLALSQMFYSKTCQIRTNFQENNCEKLNKY